MRDCRFTPPEVRQTFTPYSMCRGIDTDVPAHGRPRQGVADETKILEILSGIYEDDFEPIRVDKPEQPQLPPPEPFREPKAASPRALELAEKLKLDGNVKLTNGEIKAVYGISSPNIMSQARALLRSEGALA